MPVARRESVFHLRSEFATATTGMGAATAITPGPRPVHGVTLVAAGVAEGVVLPSTVASAPRVDPSGVDDRGTQRDGVGAHRCRSPLWRAVAEPNPDVSRRCSADRLDRPGDVRRIGEVGASLQTGTP